MYTRAELAEGSKLVAGTVRLRQRGLTPKQALAAEYLGTGPQRRVSRCTGRSVLAHSAPAAVLPGVRRLLAAACLAAVSTAGGPLRVVDHQRYDGFLVSTAFNDWDGVAEAHMIDLPQTGSSLRIGCSKDSRLSYDLQIHKQGPHEHPAFQDAEDEPGFHVQYRMDGSDPAPMGLAVRHVYAGTPPDLAFAKFWFHTVEAHFAYRLAGAEVLVVRVTDRNGVPVEWGRFALGNAFAPLSEFHRRCDASFGPLVNSDTGEPWRPVRPR